MGLILVYNQVVGATSAPFSRLRKYALCIDLHPADGLPRFRDGGDRNLLANPGLIKPAFEGRADVGILLGHDDTSFKRCREIARSSDGVFCVFFMKACSAISMPS